MWSFRTEQQDCSKVDLELPRDSATSWDHHQGRFSCAHWNFWVLLDTPGSTASPCVLLGIYLWPSSHWGLRLKYMCQALCCIPLLVLAYIVSFSMYKNPHCYLFLSQGMPHIIRNIQTLARGLVQWESACTESAPPGVSSSAPPPQ